MKKYLLILGALLLAFACKPEVKPDTPEGGKPDPANAPKVVSTIPAANATGVDLLDEIVINYDKVVSLAPNPTIKVNDAYVDDAIYVVEQSLYIPVTLKSGTKYTVKVLNPSVKDADGNYASDFTLVFTTVSQNNFNAAAFSLGAAPVDASATSEAKALYGQLKDNFGSKIYTAAMAEVAWNTTNAEFIKNTTEKYPAINAFDYIHLPSSPADWIDYGDITPVREWAGKGGIVAAGWHWAVPVADTSSTAPGPVDPGLPEEVEYDFEDVETGIWSAWQIVDSSVFEGLRAGARLKIFYKDATASSQMALKDNVEEWPALVAEDGTSFAYFKVKAGESRYQVVLDAGMLEKISHHGLVITGSGITLTSISVMDGPLSYEEIPIEFDEVKIDSWNAFKYLEPTYFESIVEGSQMVVYYKNAASNGQMALVENRDGWPGMVDGNGFSYAYFAIPAGNGHYTLQVDDLVLASLQEYGSVIGGQYYTIASVTIRIPKYSDAAPAFAPAKTDDFSFYAKDNNFKIAEALQDGTWENVVLQADLAKLADYLKLLQDENIPVLFRPLHEASGGWFWWGAGTAEDYKALWKYVFDYMGAAGVHNLIWVWTSCLGDADWYPGDDYVDIIAYDWYPQNASVYHTSGKDAWDALLAISNKKMLTLGECGAIPQPEACAMDGAMWLWAMPWYGEHMAAPYNDAAFFNSWMNSTWVITLPQQ